MNNKSIANSQTLSEKQAYALGVIAVLIQRNPDLSPTLSEIAKHLDVKKQTVSQILAVLGRKGYVTRSSAMRSIRLTDKQLPYATQRRAA